MDAIQKWSPVGIILLVILTMVWVGLGKPGLDKAEVQLNTPTHGVLIPRTPYGEQDLDAQGETTNYFRNRINNQ